MHHEYVGVTHPRQPPRFDEEPLHRPARGRSAPQLERDLAFEPRIERAVNFTEAAFTQPFEDP